MKAAVALGLLVLVVVLVVVGPLMTIWAANTLFGFGLPYTLKTWAAALILAALFSGGGAKFR